MKRLPAALLFCIGVAGAEPIVEPEEDQVTIPRATLLKLIKAYKEQAAANILLWEKQEASDEKVEKWQRGTNCT